MYQLGQDRPVFQIDASCGTPTAMIEMLVQSRLGRLEVRLLRSELSEQPAPLPCWANIRAT